MDTKGKILLATDFQEQSLIALEYAKHYAKITNSEIVLLHVLEESSFLRKMFSSDSEAVKVNQQAQKLLNEIAEKAKPDCEIRTVVEYGKVYDKIIEVANREKPKFILMGKTEEPSLSKRILGSNTLHVVNEAQFPILSVRGKDSVENLKKADNDIIVPLDLTKEIKEQLTAAIEFSKFFKSTVKIISVYTGDSAADETQLLVKLNKAHKLVESQGVQCDTKLIKDVDDKVANVILDYAKAENAHLIIIMTQQEQDFMDFFIGSNAKSILDQSEIPVLSIAPWKESEEHTIFKVIFDPLNVFDNN